MSLTLNQILEADDLPRTEFPVEEWGGSVFIRTMRADQRADIERRFFANGRKASDDPGAFRASFLSQTLCDDKGDNLVTEEQAPELMRKSAAVIERLFDAALELNGFREKDVKEQEKN